MLVSEWHAGLADAEGAEYACGESHAAILVSRWLVSGSMEPAVHGEAKALASEGQ